ncbi:YhcN/YlaJ family sporulation lipoprotein [Bacillus massilinigeriensis]|uniref:YhcN/YlaJ family sporulation lipoprotein n=1 Tax=Bacillus mediterraneensis TaxID=1805474 RepID=UPI0008F8A8A4|nr:YhcN/YlaJ family sporulation lipoprotein [Bacillus mediterraneensis]
MKKKWSVLAAGVFAIGLAACGADDNDQANDNGQQKVQMDKPKVNNTRDNKKLSLSDRAERQVEQMNEVDDANVIITNNNAYVAVKLRDGNRNNQDGNNDDANRGGEAFGGGGMGTDGAGTGNADTYGTGMGGDRPGYGQDGKISQDHDKGSDGFIDGKGDAGNKNNNQNNNNNVNNQEENKDRSNYSEVSTKFEQRIADKVRQADDRIHKVYVSFDEDFYNTMGNYTNDIRNNNNRDGLFRDFNNTIDDVFNRNK